MNKAEASLTQTWHELNLGVDPSVAKDIGYTVPEQYLPIVEEVGSLVVANLKPEIPADVRAQIDAFKAAHPVTRPSDKSHITSAYLRGRGAL